MPYSIPSYCTSTQAQRSPSPELLPSTKQATSSFHSAQLTKCSLSNLNAKNQNSCLDLKCVHSEPTSFTAESRVEQSYSPSLFVVPPSPDIRNEEILFEACTEEVYLGPPLCYSMLIKKKPHPLQDKLCLNKSLASGYELNENSHCLSREVGSSELDDRLTDQSFSKQSPGCTMKTQSFFPPIPEPCNSLFTTLRSNSSSSGDMFPPLPAYTKPKEEKLREDLYLSCDGAEGKVATAVSVSKPQDERSRNEGPSYLNPWVRVALIDSFATECLADTKMLESNMGTVMTKISVCSSATNPSKEPATTATRINPKINCSAMRTPDREEGKRRKEADTQWAEEKRRKEWSRLQQEVLVKQVSVPCMCVLTPLLFFLFR